MVDFATADPAKMVPSLAKSWEVSGDNQGTEITFHLCDGLKFNDGRSANVYDFLWSMKRVVKLKMVNAATFNEYGITEQNVDDDFQVSDAKTVVMKFDKPYLAEFILNNISTSCKAVFLDREL